MGDCKKILYGVSDYAEIRKSNGWFIARSLRLAPKGGVKLTRLSVVFHGGNMVLCSEL